jgi:hypothetical protein
VPSDDTGLYLIAEVEELVHVANHRAHEVLPQGLEHVTTTHVERDVVGNDLEFGAYRAVHQLLEWSVIVGSMVQEVVEVDVS